MNAVEKLYLEHMQDDGFQRLVHDDFGFVDNMIDQNDLNKLNDKEGN